MLYSEFDFAWRCCAGEMATGLGSVSEDPAGDPGSFFLREGSGGYLQKPVVIALVIVLGELAKVDRGGEIWSQGRDRKVHIPDTILAEGPLELIREVSPTHLTKQGVVPGVLEAGSIEVAHGQVVLVIDAAES